MVFNYNFYGGLVGSTNARGQKAGIGNIHSYLAEPYVSLGLITYLNPISVGASSTTWLNSAPGAADWARGSAGATYTAEFSGGFTNNGTINAGWYMTVDNTVTNNFTYEIVCKPNTTITVHGQATSGITSTGNRDVIAPDNRGSSDAGSGLSVGTNGYTVREHGNSYLPCLLSNSVTISSTIPTHFIITYVNKQPSCYINGVFNKTGLTSTRTAVRNSGTRIGYGDYGSFSGTYYYFRAYNRVLTTDEILINYNGVKTFYGIA